MSTEILSSADRRVDVADKIATYLAAGTAAVVVVDPKQLTIALHDARGVRTLGGGNALEHAAMPGFALDVTTLFVQAGLPRQNGPGR